MSLATPPPSPSHPIPPRAHLALLHPLLTRRRRLLSPGSGSPLGLLFDHGCDALNATVMVINCACALQLGPTPEVALLAIATWVGFYAGTLEEFYTGELYLGYINMPNEGLLLSSLIHLSGAFLPPTFWTTRVAAFGELRRNQCVLVVTCIASLITAACNAVNVFRAVASKRRMEREVARSRSRKLTVKQLQESSVWVAATRSVPTVLVFGAFGVWLLVSPSDILRRRPRLVLWAMGITNSKLATGIMLSHICDQEYHPWCRTVACLCTLLVHLFIQIWRHRYDSQPLDQPSEDLLLFEAFWLVLISCASCRLPPMPFPPPPPAPRPAPRLLQRAERDGRCLVASQVQPHGVRDGLRGVARPRHLRLHHHAQAARPSRRALASALALAAAHQGPCLSGEAPQERLKRPTTPVRE